MKIYADHAATTKMSDAAVNTLLCMSRETRPVCMSTVRKQKKCWNRRVRTWRP